MNKIAIVGGSGLTKLSGLEVIDKIDIKELCEKLEYSSQKFIDNDLQVFLDEIAATLAREVRALMPKC